MFRKVTASLEEEAPLVWNVALLGSKVQLSQMFHLFVEISCNFPIFCGHCIGTSKYSLFPILG